MSDVSTGQGPIHAEVEVDDQALMLQLTGPGATHLATLAKEFAIETGVRGSIIHLKGSREAVEGAERALMEILGVLERGQMRKVRITQSADYDLVGDVIDEAPPSAKKPAKKKIALPVLESWR